MKAIFNSKRFLSLFLAFVMVLGMLLMGVFIVSAANITPAVTLKLTVSGEKSNSYKYYIPGNSTRILTAKVSNMNEDILSYTYAWYKDGTLIDGENGSVLTLEGNVSDSGTYKVVVTATLKDSTDITVTESSAYTEKEQKVEIKRVGNTLYYNANGGEGGPSSNYTGSDKITVQTGVPTRTGYLFTGWNTAADGSGEGYKGGDSFVFADDNGNGGCKVTLYAQWVKEYYTVTYKADGEIVDTQIVRYKENAKVPEVPVKDGYDQIAPYWDGDGVCITSDKEINAVYFRNSVTENTEKVNNVIKNNVTIDDKSDLEKAKEDIEKALEENKTLYTEDERRAIEAEIKRIDDALEVIGNVEAAQYKINNLPDTITKKDEEAIKAADDAYNALTDYEKKLVGADAKKALDAAKAALAELELPTDSASPKTGDNSNIFLWVALFFISGGAVITLTVYGRKKKAVKR